MIRRPVRMLSFLATALLLIPVGYAQQPTAAPSTKAAALTNAD